MSWTKIGGIWTSPQGTEHEQWEHDSTGRTYISLLNQGFYKTIEDTSWTRIRMGFSPFLTINPEEDLPPVNFMFGLCDSSGGIPGIDPLSDTTTFIGLATDYATSITDGSYSGNNYMLFTLNPIAYYGGTVWSTVNTTRFYMPTGASFSTTNIFPLALELESSTDINLRSTEHNSSVVISGTSSYGSSISNYESVMNNYGSFTPEDLSTYYVVETESFTDGTIDTTTLDTMFVYWGDINFPLAIGDFVVSQFPFDSTFFPS